MGIAPPGADATYRGRLRQYHRRERMILWVGAGLVALIGLLTSDLGAEAPDALNASAASLIIVGGAALATARIKFEWAATQLGRAIEDGTAPDTQLPPSHANWPALAELAWYVGLMCVPAATLLYWAAIWWAVR